MDWAMEGLLVALVVLLVGGFVKAARHRGGCGTAIRYFAPLEARELLENLAVEDDNPLLRAVVHLLHRKRLELADRAGADGLPADEAKGLAMASAGVEDAADELLELVEKARAARRGEVEE